jgi:hypothetical protein
MLREIAAVDSRVTVVKLRRNFGQTIPPTSPSSWKRSPLAMTSSAAGAKFASTISGCAASLPASLTG